MLIALMSDIHGNREAFDACLNHARKQGAERYIILGDLVGYGADPAYIVDVARGMQEKGAIVLLGNHDEAVSGSLSGMNEYARAAIEWTRGKLDVAQKKWLAELPRTHREGDALYVHSDASNPAAWIYVNNPAVAERSMRASDAHVTFCGHVHVPQLFNMASMKPAIPFTPQSAIPVPLSPSRKWLAVLGAVGQPRDQIPTAAYCIYDDARRTVSYCRAPYDIERAAQKIKNAGLPAILSARLFVGR
ncbi:MAG: metallophosphatase family protein [Rhodoblastus sp.]|nr:metallophosphatase family protein [Rhodoblastus sp.]